MKKITYVSFAETLLVPRRESFENENSNVYYAGKIEGSSDSGASTTIQLFFVNCETAKEIPGAIQKEIKDAKELLKNEKIKENIQELNQVIDCYSKLDSQMNNSLLLKLVPRELLEFLQSNKITSSSNHDLIFISGVSSIIEEENN